MARPQHKSRLKQTTTGTGTGTLNLDAPAATYQGMGTDEDGYQIPATIIHRTANEWEDCLVEYTDGSPGYITRVATFDGSSGPGVTINFSAGTKDVILSLPAKWATAKIATGGRLTPYVVAATRSVDPTNKTTATAIAYQVHNHDVLSIPYNGVTFTDFYLNPDNPLIYNLGTRASETNYDIFAWQSGGTPLIFIGPAWSSNTSRGAGAGTTELDRLQGLLVNKYALTSGPTAGNGLYLGTIRTNSTTTLADSMIGAGSNAGGKRYVWNQYNQVMRPLAVIDETTSWSYAGALRQARAQAGNKVEFVCGAVNEQVPLLATVSVSAKLASNTASDPAMVAIGVDSITALGTKARTVARAYNEGTSPIIVPMSAHMVGDDNGAWITGYHYLSWLEKGSAAGTSDFISDTEANGTAGLMAYISA